MKKQETNSSPRATGWLKVSITAAPELVETLASGLADITGRGVETQSQPGTDNETVIAYLADDQQGRDLLPEIKAFLDKSHAIFSDSAAPLLTVDRIDDEDWNSCWKAHFHALKISRRLVIKPSWEEYTPANDEIVIEIDPGQAFGTGHHESTRLALTLIEQVFDQTQPPATALDVGTGTGILAIACAKYGASQVLAIDNDPLAVDAARENILASRVADSVQASGLPLAEAKGPFELVIANIIHDTLIELAPDLANLLAPGGNLVLAGILAGEQERDIVGRYCGIGFKHRETRIDGEWAAFLFAKPRQD